MRTLTSRALIFQHFDFAFKAADGLACYLSECMNNRHRNSCGEANVTPFWSARNCKMVIIKLACSLRQARIDGVRRCVMLTLYRRFISTKALSHHELELSWNSMASAFNLSLREREGKGISSDCFVVVKMCKLPTTGIHDLHKLVTQLADTF